MDNILIITHRMTIAVGSLSAATTILERRQSMFIHAYGIFRRIDTEMNHSGGIIKFTISKENLKNVLPSV